MTAPHAFWSSADGLDPLNLALYLFADHPLVTAIGLATAAWAYFMLFEKVPLLGISTGRDGAADLDTELPNERRTALEKIRAGDPGYEEEAFLKRALAAYAAVDDGWNRSDMSRARAFVSDGVFERLRRRLAELKERGLRARISELALKPLETAGYVSGLHFDAVYVSFSGSVVDEVVTCDGERPVSGGRRDFIEVWTFLRRPGAQTLSHPGPIEGRCPSCGADLEIVDAARCSACGTWVNSGEFDWVLTAVTQFAAWAFPSPDREVGGWPELRAADPGLSLEALEDRAAVVFWRWLDARRRADASPLSGVAAKEFLAALSFGPDFERDAVVAGVETTACERRADFDRVHVQISWEAEQLRRAPSREPESRGRESRTFFFIFRRRSGAASDVNAGLRTSRCPSCGAAVEQADAAACLYCGSALGDDAKAWVLADVVPFGKWRRPEG